MDYAAPLLRLARAASLEDDVRLLLSQAGSPEQLLSGVKGTRLAAKAARLEGVDDVEEAAWSYLIDILVKLHVLDSIVPAVYRAYTLYAAQHHLLRILRAGLEGVEPPRTLPELPVLQAVSKAVAERGVRGAAPILERQGLVMLASVVKSPRIERELVELASDIDLLKAFAAAVREVGLGAGGEHACYRLDALAVRATGTAIALVEASREAARILKESLEACLIPRQRLLEAIEEQSFDRLTAAIHASPYPYSPSTQLPGVEAVFHAIRRYSRQRLLRSLASDPTEPGHAVAVLELLTLDVEDVVALSAAAFAGLPREALQEVVTVTG